VKKEGPLNRYYLGGNFLRAEDEGEKTAEKYLANGRYERVLSGKLFAFLQASYLKDEFAGYDYRTWGGPGLGYEFIKTDVHHLTGRVSANYNTEKYAEERDGDDSDSYTSGKAAANYIWQITETVRFKQYADYLVSFEDTDKYYVNSESALEVKMSEYLSLGVSYLVAYQSQPPTDDFERTDTTFLTSIIVDF
jgi:putative salt-induced outer membrane protein